MRLNVPVALLAVATLFTSGACVSGSKLRAEGEVIKSDIERARKSGAYRCAPRELALAEAHLDFLNGELAEGDSVRGRDHATESADNVRKALILSKDCGPKQVLIREPEEKIIVRVEPTDRDGDGTLDNDDNCPDVPGPADNAGCPYPDRDNDGVFDFEDRCPDVPGPRENQGCPLKKDTDGDGILDDVDACPTEPGPLETRGCPIRDRDGDGIPDHLDKCPDDPEDFDGFEDEDGCPDLDNDKDGIPDTEDACPNEPGVADPDRKKNGCPRKLTMVVVKKDRIEIKQQINFDTGKATIKGANSFEILKQVTQVLKDYPSIRRLRIEGHTDSVGNDDLNMRLSQARADAVRNYLQEQGIDESRMEAAGFGEGSPIASNATAKGRAQNRRTEFNIAERD